MRLLSIDLSTKQVGFALLENTHLKDAKTIKSICDDNIYQIGNQTAIIHAYFNIKRIFEEWKCDGMIIEWAIITTTPKYVAFCQVIMSLLEMKYPGKVTPINEAKWLAEANKTFSIKRNQFQDGRKGNKEWIATLAKHYEPEFKFTSQDEKDAFVMGLTFLMNERKF